MISLLRRVPFASVLWSCALLLVCVQPLRAAGSRVTGQVLDAETQAPVAGADVELQNSGGGPGYFRTRTDGKGEFAIPDVPADRWYLVTVSADGYTDWAIESWQFPAAQREVRLAVPLDRAGKLDVLTRGSDGKPVAAARVTVRRDRGSNWWEAYRRDPEPRWTGRDGHVLFEGLSGGAWSVAVEAPGLRAEEARAVPVKRGQVTPATLTLTRPGSLSGVVRLPDSTTVSGVNVIVRGPSEVTATTDEDGAWTASDLPPGRYRAEISYDGFASSGARDGLVLAEGESKGGVVLAGTPRPQSLAFVLERDVFVPQLTDEAGMSARPSIGVRAFRIAALDLVLYRVPFARLLERARGKGGVAALESDTTGLERVHTWRYDLPEGAPFAWREAQMTLPLDLAPGAYVLAGSAGRLQRRQLFFVSDLSLVVKRSGTKLAAWVGSLRTGLALPGVSLYVQPAAGPGPDAEEARRAAAALAGKPVVTDADGLAWLTPPAGGGEISVVATAERAGMAVVQPPRANSQAVSGDKLFLFTERPLYRPGQALHWKLFARRGAGAGYVLPDRTQVRLTLRGPEQEISVPPATLSATGSATGDVTLPADAPLGDWTLSAEDGHASDDATFGVQEYRKPEFKVEVTPDREVSLNGDDVRFKVAASYFFGAPVVGATVRYTLFESRLTPEPRWDDWDPWGDGGGEREGGGYGRLLQSGETRTDLDGGVSLSFTPARTAYDRRLVLEVEVLDGAQRVVSSRGTALVGRGQFTLRVVPVTRMLEAGAPIVADVYAEDLLGKPVQAAVTIELDQDVWNPVERRTSKSARPLATLQGTTSALRGNVRATLSPATAKAGYLTVRARAQDARGNKLVSEAHVWVYDARVWEYGYRYPAFEAVPDRDRWAPGDTARILVNTDVKDAAVLVSVEGRELHELRVVHLIGRTGLVRVPIRADYGPNVFVKLHVRRGRELRTRTLELPVQSERHDLAITVTSDRATYRPQDTAKLTVETKDTAGRPVPAEVAVGVVDEALYALRADATPRAHDVFYGRIADAVTTVAAFPVLFYGGAGKGDAGNVRRDFRDVAAWEPEVRTGADGRAVVDVRWPDNLTTWRATARGVSDATLVGETVARTLVTKDVVARLAVPRTFTAGDEAQLVSVVTNRTGQPIASVKQSVSVSGAVKLTGPASAATGIASGGEARSRWSIALPADSPRDGSDARATFTFRASSPADADALEQTVPVQPRAVALRLQGAGTLGTGAAPSTVLLPNDLVASGSRLSIRAPRSARALLRGAAGWLGDYRYGCTEQTANKLCALLAAAGPDADPASLAHDALPYVQRLAALKNNDGAWGWWSAGDSDPYMSALAVDALLRAAERGVQRELTMQTVTSAQYTLLRQSTALRSLDGEAYFAMRLAGLPGGDDNGLGELRSALSGLLGNIVAQREQLSPGGLACAALACARSGRATDAASLLDAMWTRSVLANGGRSLPGGGDDDWLADEVEHTAWALEAASRLAPGDARTRQLLDWLAAHRDGREWRSTRTTGAVVNALAAWLAAHPEPGTVPPATVRWNGEVISADAAGEFAVPAGKLKPGANALEIRAEGAAPTWWSWSAQANVPSPGPAPDVRRVALKREYRRAVRTADRRGRPRWLTSALDDKQPLRVGEGVLVRLTLTAPAELRWLAIEDAVPGGFEIDQVLPEGVDRPWNTSAEARDGKAVFFLDQMGAGDTVIEYLVRPEIAGVFTALPASAFGMYDPALGTRSTEARLRVVNP